MTPVRRPSSRLKLHRKDDASPLLESDGNKGFVLTTDQCARENPTQSILSTIIHENVPKSTDIIDLSEELAYFSQVSLEDFSGMKCVTQSGNALLPKLDDDVDELDDFYFDSDSDFEPIKYPCKKNDMQPLQNPDMGIKLSKCVICGLSFNNMSENDAAIHVNRCLDGKETVHEQCVKPNSCGSLVSQNLSSLDCHLVKCPICGYNMSNLSVHIRGEHVNMCCNSLEEQIVLSQNSCEKNPIYDSTAGEIKCALCGKVLSSMNLSARENHADRCASKLEKQKETKNTVVSKDAAPVKDSVESGGKNLTVCLICGESFNFRGLGHRVTHLKQCALTFGVNPDIIIAAQTETRLGIAGEVDRLILQSVNGGQSSSSNNRKKRNAFEVMQNASNNVENKKKKKPIGTNSFSKWASRETKPKLPVPFYKTIPVPGACIIVDGFSYYHPEAASIAPARAAALSLDEEYLGTYFLTHFHYDHYKSLSSSWKWGPIYMSDETAKLVTTILNVDPKWIRTLPPCDSLNSVLSCQSYVGGDAYVGLSNHMPNQSMEVDIEGGVRCSSFDANHCPGAICLIFRRHHRVFLHSGDFRFLPNMLLLPSTISFCHLKSTSCNPTSRLEALYLDTTYCNAKYDFPLQNDVIATVKQLVLKERTIEGVPSDGIGNILFLFGSYTIGKERLVVAVSRLLNLKIWCDVQKHKVLKCIPGMDQLLTSDVDQTCIMLVPMQHCRDKKMTEVRKKTAWAKRVVAFEPTGWTLAQCDNQHSTSGMYHRKEFKSGNVLYSVPYSEHSSFSELVSAVRGWEPHRIIPTVAGSAETAMDLVCTLRCFAFEK